jgi:hypothetical protein
VRLPAGAGKSGAFAVQRTGKLQDLVRPGWLLLLLALGCGAAFLLLAERQPNVADTIGYVYAGEQLARGEGLVYHDTNNRVEAPYFAPFAFNILRPGSPDPAFGFPPGLPLLLAAGILLAGNGAVHFVVPLLSAAALWLTFLLGRELVGNSWGGFWAALFLAVAPALWQFGTAAWSEVPSLVFIVAGVLVYLRSRRAQNAGTRAVALSFFAAALLTYAFFIRYANVVTVVPALAVAELAVGVRNLWRQRWRWPFFVTLALGAGGILLFNNVYYGGPFVTNYSPQHGWYPHAAFSLAYALGPSFVDGYSLRAVLLTLWDNFSLLLLLLPLGWLVLSRRATLITAIAIISTIALYSVYAFAASGINSRFLLPVFPFLTVPLAAGLLALGRRLRAARLRWSLALLLVALLSLRLPQQINALEGRNHYSTTTAATVRDFTTASEKDAVFLSYVYNDHIIFYGQRSVLNYRRIPPSDPEAGRYRWELLEPRLTDVVTRLLDEGKPVYYIEDKTPPYADSLAILQRHFTLARVSENPIIYRVRLPVAASRARPQPLT